VKEKMIKRDFMTNGILIVINIKHIIYRKKGILVLKIFNFNMEILK